MNKEWGLPLEYSHNLLFPFYFLSKLPSLIIKILNTVPPSLVQINYWPISWGPFEWFSSGYILISHQSILNVTTHSLPWQLHLFYIKKWKGKKVILPLQSVESTSKLRWYQCMRMLLEIVESKLDQSLRMRAPKKGQVQWGLKTTNWLRTIINCSAGRQTHTPWGHPISNQTGGRPSPCV